MSKKGKKFLYVNLDSFSLQNLSYRKVTTAFRSLISNRLYHLIGLNFSVFQLFFEKKIMEN